MIAHHFNKHLGLDLLTSLKLFEQLSHRRNGYRRVVIWNGSLSKLQYSMDAAEHHRTRREPTLLISILQLIRNYLGMFAEMLGRLAIE